MLVPLGFVMGMPFPSGLRLLHQAGLYSADRRDKASENAVEWAWALTAGASVLGSVLAMVVAIQFGLNVTLGCGAAAYLAAIAFWPTLRQSA